jgi:predicted type IV restriction endonuclease
MGVEPVLLVDVWSNLGSVNSANQQRYAAYISKVITTLQSINNGRIWIVLEVRYHRQRLRRRQKKNVNNSQQTHTIADIQSSGRTA